MAQVLPDKEPDESVLCAEAERVLKRRYDEAVRAGLTLIESRLFSESDVDVGELRHLVALGCPADQIASVLL